MLFTYSKTILVGVLFGVFFNAVIFNIAEGHEVGAEHLHCDGGSIVTRPSEGSDREYSCDPVVIPDPDPVPEIVVDPDPTPTPTPTPTPIPIPTPTPTPTTTSGDPCAGIPGTIARGGICLPTSENLGIQDDPVQNILLSITLFVTGLIGVLAVLMIVVSGVMYMLSAGDTARVESSKKILTYAIIGLIVALLAWVIVSVVSRVTGAGGLEANNPDGPVTGTQVQFCYDPSDSSTCITIQNND